MIFLSYSRLNDEAYRLEKELNEAGIPYLRDASLVEGDPFWRNAIRSALESSNVLLVIWSKEASESPYIDQEIRAFTKDIIFMALDETKTPIADARLVRPREIIPILGQLVNAKRKETGDQQAQDPDTAKLRRNRLLEETEKLRLFIDQSGRPPKMLDLGGQAINKRDGTELRLVGDFWLGVDPVNNAQYRSFVEATGYPPPPCWNRPEFSAPQLPVTGITWFEAQAYASWVGGGLPSESEWELGARGDGDPVYATATGKLDESLAHFGLALGEGAPCAVDRFPPNPIGLRGMCGNVWDWTASAWNQNKIIKGGGYMDGEMFCRIPARYRNFPIDRDCCVGFRVKIARDEPQG